MSQLDIRGSQWQGRGRDRSQIAKEIPQVQFVQQGYRHALVSSNRSREKDYDFVTNELTKIVVLK